MMLTMRRKREPVTLTRLLQGQSEAMERVLTQERGGEEVVRTIAAARPALSARATKAPREHLRSQLAALRRHRGKRSHAATQPTRVIRRCLG